jgi:hypothetical protein
LAFLSARYGGTNGRPKASATPGVQNKKQRSAKVNFKTVVN